MQQVGGAIGIAVIGVIFFGQLDHGSLDSFDAATPQLRRDLTVLNIPVDAQDAIVTGARQCYHDRAAQKDTSVVPDSCKQVEQSGPQDETSKKIGDAVMGGVKQANALNFASAFRSGVVYVTVILFVICTLSVLLPRKLRMSENIG